MLVGARESQLTLLGVDLVAMFDAIPTDVDFVRLESCSVHDWKPVRRYDLITCVHGLHYVGDKVGLIERTAGWLSRKVSSSRTSTWPTCVSPMVPLCAGTC